MEIFLLLMRKVSLNFSALLSKSLKLLILAGRKIKWIAKVQ